jgi:hypothetical protein
VNVEVGGVRGVCEVSGDGPPLVLIATPLARAESYRTTAARLSRTFRVFAVGLPGADGDRVSHRAGRWIATPSGSRV